jgi:uncharacterized protein YbaP (TraB family)
LEQYESLFQGETLQQRNRHWIPGLLKVFAENVHPDEDIFVAVGAAHVFGNSNIIELLSNEGFHFEPCRL